MMLLRLRTSLLAVTIAVATVWGTGGAISGMHAASTLADGPGFDRTERAYHDGRLVLRAFELVAPLRALGLVGVEQAHGHEAARHRRSAAAVVLEPATHASHLMLLTHQRNDLDA
jgi:hypothetical protein